MNENKILKILSSLPIILLVLYFIPFLGICLILLRYYVYRNKNYQLSIVLLICGLFLLIPEFLNSIIKTFKLTNIKVPYLNDIITSTIYPKLLSYSKLLITVSIVFFILSLILKNLFNKLGNSLTNYMQQDLKKDYEIRKENDLKMQEKREKAKNTHVVHCPYCGSTNMLTEQTGICQFCRRKLEYKD